MSDGFKISLSFNKKIEKKNLQSSALGTSNQISNDSKVHSIESFDKNVKLPTQDEIEEELVIPLVLATGPKVQKSEIKIEVDKKEENKTLDELAAEAVIQESRQRLSDLSSKSSDDPLSGTLSISAIAGDVDISSASLKNEPPMLGLVSSLEDYEQIGVEKFGAAILRGMGWSKTKGIGKNAKVVNVQLPTTHCYALSASKEKTKDSKDDPPGGETPPEEIKKGSFVVVEGGRNKGLYAKVESVYEDHFLLESSSKPDLIREVELNCSVVSERQFKQMSRFINKDQYDQYKTDQENARKKKKYEDKNDKEKNDRKSDKERKKMIKKEKEDESNKHSNKETDNYDNRKKNSDKYKGRSEKISNKYDKKEGIERKSDNERDEEKYDKERDGEKYDKERDGEKSNNEREYKKKSNNERDERKFDNEGDEEKYYKERDEKKYDKERDEKKSDNEREYKKKCDKDRNEKKYDKDRDENKYDKDRDENKYDKVRDEKKFDNERKEKKYDKERNTKKYEEREYAKKCDKTENKERIMTWVHEGLRVRIIDQNLDKGKLYEQKAIVLSVDTPLQCTLLSQDGKRVEASTKLLETVVPKGRMADVRVVAQGNWKGHLGCILELQKEREKAVVQMRSGNIVTFHYDDICEVVS